jgi:hypothetical protein
VASARRSMLRARALWVVGRAPHQPDDYQLRLRSPRDHRRDCEERRPDGGHGTLLPQALRTPRYQGLEYRSQPARAGLTRRGFCRVLITVQASREALARVNRAVAGNCHFLTTTQPLTVGQSHRRGALQGLSAVRRHRRLSIEQVSEYGTPVKARPCCVSQNGRSQRVHRLEVLAQKYGSLRPSPRPRPWPGCRRRA